MVLGVENLMKLLISGPPSGQGRTGGAHTQRYSAGGQAGNWRLASL